MIRLAACLLVLVPSGFAQETKPVSRPSSFAADDTLRSLAASVMRTRIIARVGEICAFGARAPGSPAASGAARWMRDQLLAAGLTDAELASGEARSGVARKDWVAASFASKEGARRLIVSSRLSNDSPSPGAHESASGASALLESARVLQASRARNEIAETAFEIRFEVDRCANAARAASRPAQRPVAEIRFGELGLGASRDCLFVTVSADAAAASALLPKLQAILVKWKGEKGFWQEFALMADGGPPREDGATRVILSCTPQAGARPFVSEAESRCATDSCPVAGTSRDTPEATVLLEPHNAVHATRFALFLIAHLADEHRAR